MREPQVDRWTGFINYRYSHGSNLVSWSALFCTEQYMYSVLISAFLASMCANTQILYCTWLESCSPMQGSNTENVCECSAPDSNSKRSDNMKFYLSVARESLTIFWSCLSECWDRIFKNVWKLAHRCQGANSVPVRPLLSCANHSHINCVSTQGSKLESCGNHR
jgi:hypothetical protein